MPNPKNNDLAPRSDLPEYNAVEQKQISKKQAIKKMMRTDSAQDDAVADKFMGVQSRNYHKVLK